ncbi:MAG: hypothetical protein AAB691_01650, partial [Patescibacteria group bacterium]
MMSLYRKQPKLLIDIQAEPGMHLETRPTCVNLYKPKTVYVPFSHFMKPILGGLIFFVFILGSVSAPTLATTAPTAAPTTREERTALE